MQYEEDVYGYRRFQIKKSGSNGFESDKITETKPRKSAMLFGNPLYMKLSVMSAFCSLSECARLVCLHSMPTSSCLLNEFT